jgi:FkbM family methyltransferase
VVTHQALLGRALPYKQLYRASRIAGALRVDAAAIALEAAAQWLHGEPEYRIIHHFCDPKRVSIDVGAADGVYLNVFRRHSSGCVAFEPNPTSFRRLVRRFPDVRVENCALSSDDGTLDLRIPVVDGVAYSGHGTVEPSNRLNVAANVTVARHEVSTRRLDAFILDRVGMIKIDVEGHEMDVLLGAAETIDRCRPNLMIEIVAANMARSPSEIFDFFRTRGYGAYYLRAGRLHDAWDVDFDVMQNRAVPPRAGDDVLYNFFFLADPTRYEGIFGGAAVTGA